MTEIQCNKHHQPVTYICALDCCQQGYLICEMCKQKQPQHFIPHLNFIYTLKQFFMFQTSKSFTQLLPKLEKTMGECEVEIGQQRQGSKQQIQHFLADFKRLEEIYQQITRKTKQHIISAYTHDSKQFDQKLSALKMQLKELVKERDSQTTFFGFFSKKEDIVASNAFQLIDKIRSKNKSLFKFRANLLNFYTDIKKTSIKISKYKNSQRQVERFNEMKTEIERDIQKVYSHFKELFNEEELKKSMELKKSIASSPSQPLFETLDLANSNVSQRTNRTQSAPNLPKVTLPPLSSQIQIIVQGLDPLPASNLQLKDQGPFKYKQGVYFGNYMSGQRHGKGKFYFNDGSYYEGYWKNDGMYGLARLVTKSFFYEGEVNQGKAEGIGRMEDAQKVYSGHWYNDMKHGVGKLQYKSKKLKYEGSFQNNLFHGSGILTTADWKYQGGFWAGQRSGEGRQTQSNGEIFSGKFKNGNKLIGIYTWLDGSYYDGTFQNDLPHGNGTFCWPDGLKYDGTWKNGEQSGIGVQKYPDNRQRRGEWQNGEWKRWL